MNVGDQVYILRENHTKGSYDVYDCKIRTLKETYFVANREDGSKQACLIGIRELGDTAFEIREEAVKRAHYLSKTKKVPIYKEVNDEEAE